MSLGATKWFGFLVLLFLPSLVFAQGGQFTPVASSPEPLPNCTPASIGQLQPIIWDITAGLMKVCTGVNVWSSTGFQGPPGTLVSNSGITVGGSALMKGPEPWAGAIANGATCNGVADDSTSLTTTFNSVGAVGNEFRIEDNCNWVTPPNPFTTPTFWVTMHLRGRLNIGATLKLAPLTYLVGDDSQHGLNPFFGALPTANINPSSSSISPIVDLQTGGNPVGLRNITLGGGGSWTGIGILGTVNSILDNVNAESGSNTAQPLVVGAGFGFRAFRSQFAPGSASTNPAMLFQDSASLQDTSRDILLQDTFSNYQGIKWTSSGAASYGGCSDGLWSFNHIFENSNNTGNRDALTIDSTNNCKSNVIMSMTYLADANNCTLNSGSGTNVITTVEIIEPVGGGCIKGTKAIQNLFVHSSAHIGSFFPVGSPSWTGLGLFDGSVWMSNPVFAIQYNGSTIVNNPALQIIPNDTVTGTFQYRLAKITSTGAVKVLATGDTNFPAVNAPQTGNGTSGNSYIPVAGIFQCIGDNSSATIGSIVTISSAAGGDGQGGFCHDTESTVWPTTGMVRGIIQANVSGLYAVVPIDGQPGAAQTNVANTWTQKQTFNNVPVSGGTGPTISGTGACSTIGSLVGGVWAGSALCTGTTGASTLTITFPVAAPNGYVCNVQDETHPTDLFQQTSHSTTTCVMTIASVSTNDVFVFTGFAF
jgi:hypothetical protein